MVRKAEISLCNALSAVVSYVLPAVHFHIARRATFSLIVFFLIGIVIGVTIFPLKWLKANSLLQTAGISLTLFSMGASMAGGPTFLADLRAAGLRAAVFAVVTMSCSVLLVYILSRLVFPKDAGKAGGEK
ncbi:hypothetical protein D3Z39_12255 [Anaerotruncus colihominis]|uniref:DUF340 domain-containing protein n=1 Tax=Anaerotruncus colihominis TaxID=169435 RepID=A0A845RHV2_9FIRM|nr:hypothetical protein [Anaerotruncus colihominis]NBI79626.1 hypothetical protein [Anaerotruncus colihominis]